MTGTAARPAISHSGTSFQPDGGPPAAEMTRLSSFSEVNEALKSRRFIHVVGHRDNAAFLGGSLISLSGDEHFNRRRIAAALFGAEPTARYHRQVFLPALMAALARWPVGADGRSRGDLAAAVFEALSPLGAAMVGLDGIDSEEARKRHILYTSRIANGVNIEFAERDHQELVGEYLPFLERFRTEFFEPSLARRRAIVSDFRAGRIDRQDLPLDLITLMLLHEDQFAAYGPEAMLREAVLFNGASASISHGACNVVDALLRWVSVDPPARRPLLSDVVFVRRAALEAIRYRPGTPFQIRRSAEDQVLESGRKVAAGEYVLIDMAAANHDKAVFGPDADEFNPYREPLERVRPAGISFSNGAHTCIAMNLSVGDGFHFEDGNMGLLVATLIRLFALDVRSEDPAGASRAAGTTRTVFDRFRISLDLAPGELPT
ncbi:MAG: hypothetical protein BroJett024_39720 [Alphaproteobacteria bacterium]|nr:MAG: hypothetical protein BroJett024_39720 [Alphaproteobacteria bacterium]